jgi:gentisate 1,2-dioxygenase
MDQTAGATPFYRKPESSPEREAFNERLGSYHAAPLWNVLGELVPQQPQPQSVPALWRYDQMRPLLMEAGRLITAKEAERRVVILENPGLHGASRITQSLYAGLQLILPGEIAPTHRHTASALRLVIEGEGAYTAVNGERTTMKPGDLILTPSWTFHDHGNPGTTAVVWMDGLDIPLVNSFDTGFAEHHPEEVQPVVREEGDAFTRYGANLLPIEFKATRPYSPMFTYPYARSRETLEHLHRRGPLHPSHGIKMQFVNPATGGYPMPTIGAFLQWLPSGFKGAVSRATDGTVYHVIEGRGRSRVADTTLTWQPHDIFVVPSWTTVSHEADTEAVLFSFSDRPVQKALGLWREENAAQSTGPVAQDVNPGEHLS